MNKRSVLSAAMAAMLFAGIVVAPAVTPVFAADEEAKSAKGTEQFDTLYSVGRGGYLSNCSSCHAASGQGDTGPSLVANELLADTEETVRTVIHGYSYMPPFGDVLNDDQVAAILTYIRNSWGNDFGIVTPEDAAAGR